jgi:hypothetical protein
MAITGKKNNWLPGPRTEQVIMCRNWISVMDPATRTAWGIPADQFQDLGLLFAAAQELLQKAAGGGRPPVIDEQCREAFTALTGKMRFFKAHYFLVPPLDNAALVSLGLRPHDSHPTPTGTPTTQVTVEIFLAGFHQLGVRIILVSGNLGDRSNKNYRICFKVVAPGGEPITDPKKLTESFSTRRQRDLINFDYTDSGSTAYIAVQIENGEKKGPWGPIVSAVIP